MEYIKLTRCDFCYTPFMFLTKHLASKTPRLQTVLRPRKCPVLASRLHTISPLVSRAHTHIPRASFHRTCIQREESQTTTVADPSHSDLHYHLIPAPNPLSNSLDAFALTFLSSPPARLDSRTILGWLPAQSMLAESDSAGLNDFKENCTPASSLSNSLFSHLLLSFIPWSTSRSNQKCISR